MRVLVAALLALIQRMAARLKAAGYPDSDLHLLTAPGHPKEGSLVAVLPAPCCLIWSTFMQAQNDA